MKSSKLAKVLIPSMWIILNTKRELSFPYYDTLITMGQSLFLTEEELKLEINDKE